MTDTLLRTLLHDPVSRTVFTALTASMTGDPRPFAEHVSSALTRRSTGIAHRDRAYARDATLLAAALRTGCPLVPAPCADAATRLAERLLCLAAELDTSHRHLSD